MVIENRFPESFATPPSADTQESGVPSNGRRRVTREARIEGRRNYFDTVFHGPLVLHQEVKEAQCIGAASLNPPMDPLSKGAGRRTGGFCLTADIFVNVEQLPWLPERIFMGVCRQDDSENSQSAALDGARDSTVKKALIVQWRFR